MSLNTEQLIILFNEEMERIFPGINIGGPVIEKDDIYIKYKYSFENVSQDNNGLKNKYRKYTVCFLASIDACSDVSQKAKVTDIEIEGEILCETELYGMVSEVYLAMASKLLYNNPGSISN